MRPRKETWPSPEWSVRCRTCRYRKRFGAAKINAELDATRHWQRFYDHIVDVLSSEIVFTLKAEQSAYHELGDEAPF